MSDFTPEARALFEAAREATAPNAADKERVAQSLGVLLGSASALSTLQGSASSATAPPPAGPPLAPPPAAPLSSGLGAHGSGIAGSTLVKVAAVALVAGAAAVGTFARKSTVPAAAPLGAPHATVSRTAPASPREALVEGRDPPAERAITESAPAETGALVTARPRTKRSTGESATAEMPSSLQQETELLKAAQRALRAGQAAEAMSFLEEHARRFPGGALREERRAARVLALAALGRGHQAKIEADAFARDLPNSPLLDRVRAAGASN